MPITRSWPRLTSARRSSLGAPETGASGASAIRDSAAARLAGPWSMNSISSLGSTSSRSISWRTRAWAFCGTAITMRST